MKKLSEICIGHIAKQNNRCNHCKKDEYNVFCEDYKPVSIYTFPVKKENKAYDNYSSFIDFIKKRFEDEK